MFFHNFKNNENILAKAAMKCGETMGKLGSALKFGQLYHLYQQLHSELRRVALTVSLKKKL